VTAPNTPRARILLVDDDPWVRQLFNDCLTGFGHEVHAVENGATALARLETEHYDVVLTDLVMAGMSGLEVAEMVRALHPAIPIIVTTGSGRIDNACRTRGSPYCGSRFLWPRWQRRFAPPRPSGTHRRWLTLVRLQHVQTVSDLLMATR
jgi:CheY-like chemotaxis protein